MFSSSGSSSRRNPQQQGYVGLRHNSDLDQLQSSYRPFQDSSPDTDEEEDYPESTPPPMMGGGGYQRGPWPQTEGQGHHRGSSDPADVFIHTVPESSKSRWSHIDDLDSFFKKVYNYHQKHGFRVMMLGVSHVRILHFAGRYHRS